LATRKRDVNDIKLRASHKKTSTKPPRGGGATKRRPAPKPIRKLHLPPHVDASTVHREPPATAPLRKAQSRNVEAESKASDSARRLAIDIAAAALDKKAVGLEVLDVAGSVDYADFLVLMSGRSDRQVAALAEGIEEALRLLHGRRPLNVEGKQNGHWVLMDFGDVVVHVFQEEVRSMYDIEGLWEDARRVPVRTD
jgi:ribosome-associated protein